VQLCGLYDWLFHGIPNVVRSNPESAKIVEEKKGYRILVFLKERRTEADKNGYRVLEVLGCGDRMLETMSPSTPIRSKRAPDVSRMGRPKSVGRARAAQAKLHNNISLDFFDLW
jgi:hypothetical protein